MSLSEKLKIHALCSPGIPAGINTGRNGEGGNIPVQKDTAYDYVIVGLHSKEPLDRFRRNPQGKKDQYLNMPIRSDCLNSACV